MRLVTGHLPRERCHILTPVGGRTRRTTTICGARLPRTTGFTRLDARPPRLADIEDIERIGVELHERCGAAIKNRVEVLAVTGPFPRAPENRPREIGARR